jgi:NAD(P)-dependent dehydrogenase (short-subunit alcohol dehydrogenase family)
VERGVAVVTGAGGDMGLACARRLGRSGRSLLLAELDGARLRAAAQVLHREGLAAREVACDVSDPAAVRGLAQACAAAGPLAALVHTAGLSPTMAGGERILRVNLVGTALLAEAFRPLACQGSAAVLIASQAAHFAADRATPALDALLDDPLRADLVERLAELDPDALGPAAYPWSKRGVIRLALREAPAWGARGARIVSLSPGIIDTGMGRQEFAQQPFMTTIVAHTPLGRMGSADEIAAVVEFLCSDAASFVTGTDVLVDGGSTAAVRSLLAPRPR